MKMIFILSALLIVLLSTNIKAQVSKTFPNHTEILGEISAFPPQNRLSFDANSKTLENWILVDTLPNSFSPALWSINPIAYDEVSNIIGFVHRGYSSYATGSGELWYNLSTDAGQSWIREGTVNSALPLNAHYPSMAIYNSMGGGTSAVKGLFVWAQPPGLGYALVEPLISGTPTAYINPNYYGASSCWAGENWMYWSSGGTLFRTQDFINIEIIEVLNDSANFMNMGGVWLDGNVYMGYLGTFDHPNPANPIYSGWYPGYVKSTDNGATWQQLQVIDFRTIEGLENYDRLFDYLKGDNFVSYSGDINVDKDGYVHLIISVTDTTLNSNTGLNSLVEVFETSAGWKGKVIAEDIDDMIFTIKEGPAVEQMGPSGYLAFDSEREVIVCVWVMDNKNSALELCDVYLSYREINSDWSTPINLTETHNMNENGAHLAPTLMKNPDGSYTAYVGYFYELGYFGPDPNNLNPTGFWIAPVTFLVTDISEPGGVVENFLINQNYPNPFNPSTKISWQSPVGSHQTLKVYDILGNEVATLVNEYKPAGKYEVTFYSHSGVVRNLPSGVYFYQLKAGDFIQTKKMVLLK